MISEDYAQRGLLNEGRSLDEVREVLGHADRKTTDRYARLRVNANVFDVMPKIRFCFEIAKKPRKCTYFEAFIESF